MVCSVNCSWLNLNAIHKLFNRNLGGCRAFIRVRLPSPFPPDSFPLSRERGWEIVFSLTFRSPSLEIKIKNETRELREERRVYFAWRLLTYDLLYHCNLKQKLGGKSCQGVIHRFHRRNRILYSNIDVVKIMKNISTRTVSLFYIRTYTQTHRLFFIV